MDAVSVLASAYHSARRLRDAIPLYEQALGDRERVQGPDDPDTIGARGNLASAYHSAGRMASAVELYERTRADCQRVLGPDHPDTLAARANLAHGYYRMGRISEASEDAGERAGRLRAGAGARGPADRRDPREPGGRVARLAGGPSPRG